ncbi:MAG: hypothetical protein COB98_02645 [Flavobacteriaceae bacterium]|nr:MAG: hypothetical protein COB98_02645 [Flavobacteriaceae bacterium]
MISKRNATLLQILLQGNTLRGSTAKHALFKTLIAEDILQLNGRIKQTIQLIDPKGLLVYLKNQHQIKDLDAYITALEDEDTLRATLVKVAGDSKIKKIRTFKGFLINSYIPLEATLNKRPFLVDPLPGSFHFVYDFETFIPPVNCTIIGVENSENFRHIQAQAYLFKNLNPLFVSRYPQNQSKDLLQWLQSIPNNYLHFGDFDFAGIGIYLNEYKKHLQEKAAFFIPPNIEWFIENYGDRHRFNIQKENYDASTIKEKELLQLIDLIKKHTKGLDQEFFIGQPLV